MTLKAPAAAAATTCSPVNWFLAIFLAAFLTIISAAVAADVQSSGRELNPAEKWVVARITAGQKADLTKQFPEQEDRKLSAHFLEGLLTGALPGVKLHQDTVEILWATIDERINLGNAQIPYEVWLDHCQFNETVTLAGASFARTVSFNDSAFKAEANLNNTKVGRHIFFQKAVFEGPVDFISADIVGQLVATEAQFQNKEQGANFNSMKVGGAAIFSKAVFEGPVDFRGADIASVFSVDGAKFQNKGAEASFGGMKVRGFAFFNDAVFEGPVDLSYADFARIDISSPFWPKVAAQFQMQAMSYKYVCAAHGTEPESHKALLKLADQSAYTADVYSNLEEFFLRQGYRADADRAFIAGKRRERKENLYGLGWLGSWLLDWLVGYGRRPWQAGIPCAALVALGCVLFSPKKMELQKPEDAPRVYSRFWYSLGLFLPFVDLQADKVWKPKVDQTFLRNYVRVHILLGWILVPLVLAALTGLIK
jgi:uncharacterized protein YjbI with pentapeptide repeats